LETFFSNYYLFNETILNHLHLFIGRWFDYLMIFFTMLGNEISYTLIIPILYWCYNKEIAIKAGLVFLVSAGINDIAKIIFNNPRPDILKLLPEIQELAKKYSPGNQGFPSGHTQGAVSFFGSLAYYTRKKVVIILAVTAIIAVPYSRLYLGVHYPGDVLGGYILGFLSMALIIPLVAILKKFWSRINFLPISIVLLPIIFSFIIPGSSIPKIFGITSGFLIGLILANKKINFIEKNFIIPNILKILIGFILLLLIKEGTKIAFQFIAHNKGLDFTRYWLVGFWITYGAPLLFTKINFLNGKNNSYK